MRSSDFLKEATGSERDRELHGLAMILHSDSKKMKRYSLCTARNHLAQLVMAYGLRNSLHRSPEMSTLSSNALQLSRSRRVLAEMIEILFAQMASASKISLLRKTALLYLKKDLPSPGIALPNAQLRWFPSNATSSMCFLRPSSIKSSFHLLDALLHKTDFLYKLGKSRRSSKEEVLSAKSLQFCLQAKGKVSKWFL